MVRRVGGFPDGAPSGPPDGPWGSMSTPPDSPLVRHWGEYRQKRRRRAPPRRVWWLLAGAAIVGLGLATWNRVRTNPWHPPSGTPHFSACSLGDVSGRCARLAVPEDPRRPHGRAISLRVAVLPATRRPAAGALFYLEGGPGVPATQSAARVNELFAEVGRDRDIVMVDQRGTGGSNRLACPDERVRATDAAAVTSYLHRCFARLRGDSRLYTTSVAAEDLESVRRTLGYGKIDLYGGSYGATLAQAYMRQHPGSVRSAVLDGGSLPGVPVYERSARNAEHALDVLLRRCAAASDCRRAYPHPRQELAELLARPPRSVTVEAGTFLLGPGDIAWTIASLSENADGAATIPFAIHEAVRGNYLPLGHAFAAEVGANLAGRTRLATVWVILCSEPWAGIGPVATARAGAGSYLAGAAVARAQLFRRACRGVPKGRVPPGSASVEVSRAPVLLLAGGADPLDPVANLSGWRHAFPNGRLVVVPGAGHGVIGYPCVQALVTGFVARGSTSGLDTSCVRHVPLPSFVTG
jgi:pimeloyl-ACP methyl ester carboxylesterase